MNHHLITLIAFLGGICLAVQSAFAAQLGNMLKNPVIASVSTYSSGALFAIVFVLFFQSEETNWQTAKHVPWYLWFIGGLFSVTGITLYYFTIPKIGLGSVMAFGLCGQLFFAAVVGHFGWFNLPVEPITIKRMMGVIAMATGIFLMISK